MFNQPTLINQTASANVEDMTFELPRPQPIRGFPELIWAGKRPFTSTHYFPAQKKESYGDPVNGWMNRIYWGDNLQVMSNLLKEFRGKVDLAYIDPPFDSKADYKKSISLKNSKEFKSDLNTFKEKQYSDIWTNDEYLQFMYERIIIIRELLTQNGSIFLHCDPRKGYLLRNILDEVFGPANFRNEVVWHYTGGGRSESTFSKKHDIIWYILKVIIIFLIQMTYVFHIRNLVVILKVGLFPRVEKDICQIH